MRSVREAVFIFHEVKSSGHAPPPTCAGARAVGQVHVALALLLPGPGAGSGAHRCPQTSGHRSGLTCCGLEQTPWRLGSSSWAP